MGNHLFLCAFMLLFKIKIIVNTFKVHNFVQVVIKITLISYLLKLGYKEVIWK
jgi:hypothetical protein